jgi:hypothetical protein
MPIADLTTDHSRVRDLTSGALEGVTTAVSLHAHTYHSSESMACVPAYLDRIPVVTRLFRREMRAYVERNGTAPDFSRGWWHPPFSPAEVWKSEAAQIAGRLGLMPLVSITDHDSIAAGFELRASPGSTRAPISLEWTVPFEQGFLHLGVHHLRAELASAQFARLAAYTANPDPSRLEEALDELDADPEVLIALNHPLWDLAGVGAVAHVASLKRFLAAYGERVHAVELNGYRPWRENSAVCSLAEAWHLPLVAGGDRHGSAANSLLNLTSAASFGGFVAEVREDRRTELLIMPEYHESLVTRKLAVARDVIRHDPTLPPGRQRWMDRVTCECEGTIGPMTEHWPGGGPLWVRSAIGAFVLLTGSVGMPLLRVLTAVIGASTSHAPGPAAVLDAPAEPATSLVAGDVTR